MTDKISIIVASRNPVKLAAVRGAFASHFPAAELGIDGIEVDSGVNDQPDSDDETRRGARNRADAARLARPDADYWVGLEGGIENDANGLMAFAWMVIRNRDQKCGEARTVTLPLPPAVRDLIDSGLELGEANDQVFATVNSKQGGGAFGLLTNGLLTRERVYQDALTVALVPCVHELFAAPGADRSEPGICTVSPGNHHA